MYNISNTFNLIKTYNLTESYDFYKQYHQNDTNIIIHIFCIPLIAWSLSVFLSKLVLFKIFNINIKANFFMLSLYHLFYSNYDEKYFIPMGIYLFLIYITSEMFIKLTKNYYYYAFIIHLFSWILQFIGHGFFEGNRPALTDSLGQALIAAPLFSYLDFKKTFL
jgi:uncharacterized membrane protein YGL010W